MNRFKILFMMLTIGTQFALLNATTTSSSPKYQERGSVVLQHQKPASKRPNAPSRIYIECTYGDGFIEFTFPDGVHSFFVSLSNGVEVWSGTVNEENTILDIPILG